MDYAFGRRRGRGLPWAGGEVPLAFFDQRVQQERHAVARDATLRPLALHRLDLPEHPLHELLLPLDLRTRRFEVYGGLVVCHDACGLFASGASCDPLAANLQHVKWTRRMLIRIDR